MKKQNRTGALRLGLCLTVLAAASGADLRAASIININLGGTNKVGFGAVGLGTNDSWNSFDLTGANATTTKPHYIGVWEDGSTTGAKVKVVHFSRAGTNASSDAMFGTWLKASGETTLAKVRLVNIPPGIYDVYVFGVGLNPTNDNARPRVAVRPGTSTARYLSPYKYTGIPDGDYDVATAPWVEDRQYVVFRSITVAPDQRKLVIRAKPGNNNAMYLNGVQIVDTNANLNPILPGVQFSPVGGTAVPVNVTLSVPGHGAATIYYTLDGSVPTSSSPTFGTGISLSTAATIRAFATESAHADSVLTSASYPQATLPDVVFNPGSGAFLPTNVTMLVPGHAAASIYYTIDGGNPDTNSAVYSTAVSLTTGSWIWSVNQVPVMSGWTSPGNTVTNSSVEAGGGNHGWKAFDGSSATSWQADGSGAEWVGFEYPSTRTIAKYAITAGDTDGPRAWSFEGWNGSGWDVLDMRSSQTNWVASQRRDYNCTNTAAYLKYRLNVSTANPSTGNPGALITVGEIEMYEARVTVGAFATEPGSDPSATGHRYYHAPANVSAVDPIDWDGDGLNNVDEAAHGTDPNNSDTDGDGLGDGIEVALGLNPTVGLVSGSASLVRLQVLTPLKN